MYFLCPNHRSQLTRLPQAKLSEYWLDWMLQAGNHYETSDWTKAVSFSGCALDLTSSALQRKDVNRVNLATEATLSTIYTTNMLIHDKQFDKANDLAEIVSQRIIVMMFNSDNHHWAECCLDVIGDQRKHFDFFTEYMSLPFLETQTLTTFCA